MSASVSNIISIIADVEEAYADSKVASIVELNNLHVAEVALEFFRNERTIYRIRALMALKTGNRKAYKKALQSAQVKNIQIRFYQKVHEAVLQNHIDNELTAEFTATLF